VRPIEKLVEIASAPLSLQVPDLSSIPGVVTEGSFSELASLLGRRNGFYAFESALLVLPTEGSEDHPSLAEWNERGGWRARYPEVADDIVFFAQDLFACQFGISPRGIFRLDPESGALTRYSDSLEAWARKLLTNYDSETGWPVARDWQQRHGPLRRGFRLLPKMPFILGGDFVVDNMVEVPAREAMRKLGHLYEQVRGVPDGTPLTVHGWLKD
jgi:hypothetical protein